MDAAHGVAVRLAHEKVEKAAETPREVVLALDGGEARKGQGIEAHLDGVVRLDVLAQCLGARVEQAVGLPVGQPEPAAVLEDDRTGYIC